jgi:hypothetical protein
MKLAGFMAMIVAILLPVTDARVDESPSGPQVGDTYEITMNRDSAQQSNDHSSGSSHDRDTVVERVVGVRADGLELEYDFAREVTAEQRAGDWQFPVRIFKPDRGPMQLLNRPELEARVETWLQAAKLTRAACGHWYFTWNAFQIECDPQSVIKSLETFDLRFPICAREALIRNPRRAAPRH